MFTGLNTNAVWNVGVHIEYRSNTINGLNLLAPFAFKDRPEQRMGLTLIAPAIKVAPFSNLTNFSIQSSFSFPLFDEDEKDTQGVFLDQKSFIWQNKVFLITLVLMEIFRSLHNLIQNIILVKQKPVLQMIL